MDLDDIKVFREVALHGSMTKAAETLDTYNLMNCHLIYEIAQQC